MERIVITNTEGSWLVDPTTGHGRKIGSCSGRTTTFDLSTLQRQPTEKLVNLLRQLPHIYTAPPGLGDNN